AGISRQPAEHRHEQNPRHGPHGDPVDELDASEDDRQRERGRRRLSRGLRRWAFSRCGKRICWNFLGDAASSRRQSATRTRAMHLSNESLLVILFVGLVAGWLAGKIMRGYGFGLLWDLIIGIVGALIGDWLLPRLGIHLGTGIVAAIVNA